MDGETVAVKTNGIECQRDVDRMARLCYACVISENDYGIECESFNNFFDYFLGRYSNVSLPPILEQGDILEQGERYPHKWRSIIWRWSKKPELARIE